MSSLLRLVWFAVFAVGIGLGAVYSTQRAYAMEFQLASLSGGKCKQNCPSLMVATGVMTSGTLKDFLIFAQGAAGKGASNVLIIDSPGGHLIEGVQLGLVLRRLKTSVFVGRVIERQGATIAIDGSCMSACVYALMGGQKRFVTTGSQIGVHREYLPSSGGKDPLSVLRSEQRFPKITNMLRVYTKKMGVDPALIDLAEKYGVGGIRMLTAQDITRFRLAKIAR